MVRCHPVLLAALVLTACAPANAVRPKASTPPAATAAPTTTTAATPRPPAFLKAPATPSRLVKGVLQLDAGYVTATNAGSIIGGNASTALGMGHLRLDAATGALISNDGAGLITNDGGGIISGNAGAVISGNSGAVVAQGAGNVIAPNGGTVIAPNGAGVVSPNGGSVIAPNGGTVIAPNGGTYRLAADASSQALVPAAGMLLQAVQLGVDKPIPLGVDAEGHPAYAIYTNGGGHFEVYLPATEAGTIHLRAIAPNLDARLVYDHVGSPPAGQELAIDEDTAQASRYLLGAFKGKLAAILAAPDLDDPAFRASVLEGTHATPELGNFLWPVAHTFVDRVKAAGIPPERYEEAAGHAAEALLRTVKLEDIPVDRTNANWKGGPADEKAIDALVSVFKLTREEVARLGNPEAVEAFFAKQDYMDYANHHLKKGQQPYRIRKHSDVGDFMVEQYFSALAQGDVQFAGNVFFSLLPPGTTQDPDQLPLNHLYAAASGIGLQLVLTFVQDEAAQAAAFAAIDAMKTKP
jgi:hypothetical protein